MIMSSEMLLIMAGEDRSKDLGKELVARTHAHPCPDLQAQIDREPILTHPRAIDSTEPFSQTHLDLLRHRQCVNLDGFTTPAAPGIKGRLLHRIRLIFWSLLRYQHEWSTRKQNSINTQLTYALQFEQEERKRETDALRNRIDQLEQQLNQSRKASDE